MRLQDLAKPFPAEDVEWRVQSSGEKNGQFWARVLAYITNRAIMERLDEVCGPENWKNEYQFGPDGAVLCGISIKFGGEWVTKWDGAENTDIEAVKGGLSGAMKRAGYQWGIGRYLYNLEEGFAKVSATGKHHAKTKDNKQFRWDPPALPKSALPEEEPAKPAAPGQIAKIRELAKVTGDEAVVEPKLKTITEIQAAEWIARLTSKADKLTANV